MSNTDIRYNIITSILSDAKIWEYANQPIEKCGNYYKSIIFMILGAIDAIEYLDEVHDD